MMMMRKDTEAGVAVWFWAPGPPRDLTSSRASSSQIWDTVPWKASWNKDCGATLPEFGSVWGEIQKFVL